MDSNSRKTRIIKELIASQDYITGKHLARLTNVTTRTVREDIKALNASHKQVEIISVPGRGYLASAKCKQHLNELLQSMSQKSCVLPVLPQDRVLYITKKLLFQSGYISMDTIADDLFVSKSTIENDLYSVDRFLGKYSLTLDRKPSHGSKIKGTELQKRNAMTKCIMADVSSRWNELKKIADPYIVDALKRILFNIEKKHHLNISNHDFIRLIVYLGVSVTRLRDNKTTKPNKDNDALTETTEYAIAKDIAKEIKNSIDITVPSHEVSQIATQILKSEAFEIDLGTNDHAHNGRITTLVKQATQEINDTYKMDLFDQERIWHLVAYYESVIYKRNFTDQTQYNDIRKLKEEYPSAIEMAIMISSHISKEFSIEFTEDHIIGLALICATAIEERKLTQTKNIKNAIIICSSGIGGSQLLAVKTKRLMPNINIFGIYPEYRLYEAMMKNPDFILSTISLENVGIPVIICSPILNHNDISNIHQVIEKLDSEEKEKISIFSNLFKEKLFINHIHATSRDEVIRILCNRIYREGYVDENYEQKVFDREKITTTAIGNLLAIPHGISETVKENTICVGILDKPINWAGEKVQMVFLLNIQNLNDNSFKKLYERFFEIINTKHKIKKLIKAADFNEFITELER